jgi:hypothetical protein
MPNLTASHRYAQLGLISLAAVLAAACTAGAAPTSAPTGAPTGSPGATPPPTARPTTEPTPSVPASPETGGGTITHPTDPDAIVLQMYRWGGFVPVEYNLTDTPVFTLYGDGTAVFRGAEPGPGPGVTTVLPPLFQATLNDEQVDALLGFALEQGGLRDARGQYEDQMIADAPWTTFVIDAGGVQKTVNVMALAESAQGADAAERGRFFALARFLERFEEEARAGQVEELSLYQPELYRVMLLQPGFGQLPSVPWPWEDLELDDFEPMGEIVPYGTGMTQDQVSALLDAMREGPSEGGPNGGVRGLAVVAPDDTVYPVLVRPLLRGETVPFPEAPAE